MSVATLTLFAPHLALRVEETHNASNTELTHALETYFSTRTYVRNHLPYRIADHVARSKAYQELLDIDYTTQSFYNQAFGATVDAPSIIKQSLLSKEKILALLRPVEPEPEWADNYS